MFALPVAAAPQLYGLTRNRHNCTGGAPSGCTQLVRIEPATGALTSVGPPHLPLTAVGDLAAIADGVLYTLADGLHGSGTVLFGIDVASGEQTCEAHVLGAEVGEVGGMQSLHVDAQRRRLVLSGPILNNATQHYHHLVVSLSLEAKDVCSGQPTTLATFAYADYEPMAHGAEYDAAGQRLFVTISSDAHAYALAVVDVSGGGADIQLLPYSGTNTLWGPQWSATTKLLSGVGVRPSGPGIDWRTLDPASGAWTSQPLANTTFDTLWGNLGSLRAYDAASASLYVLVAQGQSEQLSLAAVDATGTVQSHARLHGDVGSSSEVLMSMAIG